MRIRTFLISLLLTGSAFAGTQETITLKVHNMTCAVCPITVKKALEQVPGVNDVKINFENKTATVLIDTERQTLRC